MKTWKILSKAILPILALLVLAPSAHAAADYSFETTAPQDYYKSTSYEDIYGSQYNYGGRNVVDYQVPELEYGLQSTTMTGVMERTILPGLQQTVATGGGGYGVAGGGPITELVEADKPGSAIPLEILNKPGPLNKDEFAIMKSHTTQGCDLLERIPELRECEAFPAICDVCRHHHERWDGAGYPDRLAGEEITPWVQVVGLADAFDALVHSRAYKSAFTQEQASSMIVAGACGAFDPLLLACFARHIGTICQAVYA